MNAENILKLLHQLQQGELSVDTVAQQLATPSSPTSAATGEAHVDLDRRRRCGFPEVIFCEGKTTQAICEIINELLSHDENCFATRVSPQQADEIRKRFPEAQYNRLARAIRVSHAVPAHNVGNVAVITAGTSDRPVAEEAVETLRWMECGVELIVDVGVAGPHRLGEHRDRFFGTDAIVVVAGMEGALPSVVGGWVDCPVIAVPTSIGYGANFGGVAALLGMLNSCASNVTVVNIDSGFKGGYVAGLIARRTAQKADDERGG